ncbi:MAG: SDR family NAD(P)-dependent oxidoreductase [Candidatus Latescibacteria bacterium]|jgi:short-subunit dehydrogenase|nr:SDR family NAD(P)-dependent oxidoreductase [Candidatus Latescibacterota bacterium]MBT4137429.1 SDR family NAD(P)-dependent oxidoreductase [Candidatus Latescibacterota bacterium]MBT5831505.1 SDR family NAD(P)-dependent oxidoreductase [Candidatus Latescibacterota bacterium]
MKTILITGATDGIGKALAQNYHKQDERLVLIGRRPLAQLNDPIFTPNTYCQADLNLPDCADRITSFLTQHNIDSIDIAIQNAGVGYYGPIAEQSSDSIQNTLTVNLIAPLKLSQALYLHLKKTQGKLVFIGSIAHALPAPDYAVYAASKTAINAFAQNLRIEWQNEIAVQTIHPGPTRTGMHKKIGMDQKQTDWTKFPAPEIVAQQIIRIIKSKHPVSTIGTGNAIATFAGKYMAGTIDTLMRMGRK